MNVKSDLSYRQRRRFRSLRLFIIVAYYFLILILLSLFRPSDGEQEEQKKRPQPEQSFSVSSSPSSLSQEEEKNDYILSESLLHHELVRTGTGKTSRRHGGYNDSASRSKTSPDITVNSDDDPLEEAEQEEKEYEMEDLAKNNQKAVLPSSSKLHEKLILILGDGDADANAVGNVDRDEYADSHIDEDDDDNNVEGSGCHSHESCEECYSSSWDCHWCEFDDKCHRKLSPHGCRSGISCSDTNYTTSPTPVPTITPSPTTTPEPTPTPDPTPAPGKKSDKCASHGTCHECYHSSWDCHWCSKDNQCHAKLSRFGCTVGASCPAGPNPPPKPLKGCAAHTTCGECSKSRRCHWCAFDDKCHSIGSVYGCAMGVSCYSNHECQRSHPQYVRKYFTMPRVAAIILISVASMIICCLTTGFCIAKGVKGAYDDLAYKTVESSATAAASYAAAMGGGDRSLLLLGSSRGGCPRPPLKSVLKTGGGRSLFRRVGGGSSVNNTAVLQNGTKGMEMTNMLVSPSPSVKFQQEMQVKEVSSSDGIDNKDDASANDSGKNSNINIKEKSGNQCNGHGINGYHQQQQQQLDDASSLTQSLLPGETPSWALEDLEGDNIILEDEPLLVAPDSTVISKASKSKSANYLYCCCKCSYIFVLILILLTVVLTMYYFPRIPQYNVCSNHFDWKSIVDGMTSLKMEGSFQILLSIYNPNRFDIDLINGSGKFMHEGAYVGRFNIPPSSATAESISDFVVTATFTPDKWEALSLTSEYYKGTLTFMVESSVTVSSPFLGGYTYHVNFDDLLIKVSDVNMDDRSLCACTQQKGIGDEYHANQSIAIF